MATLAELRVRADGRMVSRQAGAAGDPKATLTRVDPTRFEVR